jgi:hypothetical protein
MNRRYNWPPFDRDEVGTALAFIAALVVILITFLR